MDRVKLHDACQKAGEMLSDPDKGFFINFDDAHATCTVTTADDEQVEIVLRVLEPA